MPEISNCNDNYECAESVTFREFRRGDMKYLADLLYRLWLDKILRNNNQITHDGNFAGLSKVKGLIAREYLLSFLKDSTYSVTAVLPSGIPCGYLFGLCASDSRRKNNRAFRRFLISLRQFTDCVLLSTSKYGRIYLEHMKEVDRAFKALSRAIPADCDGELLLFIVRGDLGGKGIGSRLLADFKDYLQMNGCRRYFLHADDDCNTGYYDKHGYTRVSSTDVDYKDGRSGMQFHLYLRDM